MTRPDWTPEDVAALAKGLTKDQRMAVRASNPGVPAYRDQGVIRQSLLDANLAFMTLAGPVLTPLGLAARAHLLAQDVVE